MATAWAAATTSEMGDLIIMSTAAIGYSSGSDDLPFMDFLGAFMDFLGASATPSIITVTGYSTSVAAASSPGKRDQATAAAVDTY